MSARLLRTQIKWRNCCDVKRANYENTVCHPCRLSFCLQAGESCHEYIDWRESELLILVMYTSKALRTYFKSARPEVLRAEELRAEEINHISGAPLQQAALVVCVCVCFFTFPSNILLRLRHFQRATFFSRKQNRIDGGRQKKGFSRINFFFCFFFCKCLLFHNL